MVLPGRTVCQEPAANQLAFRDRSQVTDGCDPPIEHRTKLLEDRAVTGIIGEVVDLVKVSLGVVALCLSGSTGRVHSCRLASIDLGVNTQDDCMNLTR